MILHHENDNGTTSKKAGLGTMLIWQIIWLNVEKRKKEYQILENI